MADKDKAGRLAHQFGKFGEGLVLWWLGQFYNYNVALVDHEGADIVAHSETEHLAISVKSVHASNKYYDKHNQDKLKEFAEKFGGLTPAVAFVFAWGEKEHHTMIDVFLLKLDEIEMLVNNHEKGFSRHKKDENTYLISNGTNFETLKPIAEKYGFKHLRLQQTTGPFKHELKGETNHGE